VRRRFFVEQFEGDQARMVGENSHHLGKVLRAQRGQLYELSDGQRIRLGRISRVERDTIVFELTEDIPAHSARLAIMLLLAIVKFDRFEWALEKATELGVEEIVPLIAERSEKALIVAAAKRVGRWKKIVLEAAQQSRQLKAPSVTAPTETGEALRKPSAAVQLILSETSQAPPLRSCLPERSEDSARLAIALAIGPEGGWTAREFELARASRFVEVSLGRTILRTETAVVAALAALNYALGD
jgi:16S rRNA (uracil1498-N3)-methyltransferase